MGWGLLVAYLTFANVAFAAPSAVNNWITTQPAIGSTAYGTIKHDQMPDTIGGATLVGKTGDDVYQIADSRSKIVENAGEGIDSVTAYTNFKLPSHVEYLNLQGTMITGVAADTGSMVSSFGSRNVMASGRGNDILADRSTDKQNLFQFDVSSGKDSVYGFTATGANHDLIRLNYSQFTSFDAVKAKMVQVGSDVRIDLTTSDSILLRGVNLGDLTADDFLLPFSPINLKQTFADEFNSLSLYKTGGTWMTSFRYGPADGSGSLAARTLPGNGEKQIYTDATYAGDPTKSTSSLGLDPFSISNGVLSITAEKLTDAESAKLWGYDYSSGLLTTEKTFSQTYGYFEIKADLPQVKGMFPAFWLMPKAAVWPPEIDIMENVGENYASSGAITASGRDAFRTFFPEGQTGMHTYGLLWTAEKITWYVDGNAVGSIPTPESMNQPMYMIFNMAVGGDWAGDPAASFTSATMKVDYVRAYSLDQVTAAAPPAPAPAADLTLNGTTAADALTGGDGNDMLNGGSGNDTLTGGNGHDNVLGASGYDSLNAGAGNDTLDGGAGKDTMSGGTGDDSYLADTGSDQVVEAASAGYDRVTSSAAFTLGANVEELNLSGAADIFGRGNDGANVINGNAGKNALTGYAGNDRLNGNEGNDTLAGGVGNDTLLGGTGTDRIEGNEGNDLLTGGAGVDTFSFGWTFGVDHITDFGAGHERDVIDLSTWISRGINPVLTQTSVGAQIAISGGYSIVLDGVDASHLVATSTGYVYDGL
jgi:serralysin